MRLNIEINERLQKDIKNYATINNVTIKDFITEAIENKIQNKNQTHIDKDFIVGIICGGPSMERGISLNSARSVADHLEGDDFNIRIFYVDQNKNFYKINRKQLYSNTPSDFDFKLQYSGGYLTEKEFIYELKNLTIAFPVIHGNYGEDGTLQKLFEDNNIPFVGSSSNACKNGFNKIKAAEILSENGFFTFPFISILENKKENHRVIERFFDLNQLKKAVVKPADGGSSIGVYCVYSYLEAIEKVELLLKQNMSPIVVEPFCLGREFTIILTQNLKTRKPVALIPSEIEMKYENYQIFDYRRKYLPTAQTRYYTPARFRDEEIEKIQKYSEEIFRIMNFEDIVRIDGWLLNDGRIWFSDLNIASGMEQNSFVFQQASKIGMTHSDFIRYILKLACLRYNIEYPDKKKKENKKKTVNVLFGGSNAERQVSLMSGTNVWLKLLKSEKYTPKPYLLDKEDNIWHLPYTYTLNHTVEEIYENCLNFDSNSIITQTLVNSIREKLGFDKYTIELPKKYSFEEFLSESKKEKAFIFVALHGGKGENGFIQEYLNKYELSYNGSSSDGSKLCMDKFKTGEVITKLNDSILVTAPKVRFNLDQFKDYSTDDYKKYWEKITSELSTTEFIIKPCNDGSSAGVARIYDVNDFRNYIDILEDNAPYIPANTLKNQTNIIEIPSNNKQNFLLEAFIDTDEILLNDNKIIYNKKTGWLELTVGVIEQNGLYHSFNPSITIASNKILTIEEKFQGGTGINITPPPLNIINKEFLSVVKEKVEEAARALNIKNYARLDIFVNVDSKKVVLIESNTLPALTPSTVIFHQALEEKTPMSPIRFIEKIIEIKTVLR